MERPDYEGALARKLAQITGTCANDWYLVYRARHGMQVAFEAAREAMGEGTVATQLLTCCTAVDPILAAGLTPVYGEVDAATCALDPELLPMDEKARAVVLQHTFGIVDDASSAELAARAHKAGALVIEDCAHCVGRMARNADGAPVADVSVHSFGVEKILHTLFGGAVWVNPDSPLAGPAAEALREARSRLVALPEPAPRFERLAKTYPTVNRVLVHLPAAVSRPLRRALTSAGAFDPAVSEEERLGRVSHAPMRPTAHACAAAASALEGYEANLASRKEVISAYRARLSEALRAGVPLEVPAAALAGEPQPLLRMPVIAASTALAEAATRAICEAGFYTTAWYRPELGPGALDEATYLVPRDRSGLQVNDRLVAGIVNLPTDIDPARAPEVVRALLGVLAG